MFSVARNAFTSALVLAACSGQIERADETENGEEPPDLVAPECETVGPPMLRRLSSVQWRNSLRAVLGADDGIGDSPLTDPPVHGFRVDATQAVVRDTDSFQLMLSAESIASWVVSSRLPQISSCQEQEPT